MGAQLSVASVISANKGSRPYYDEDADAPRFGETLVQRLRRLYRALQLEARQFDLFHPQARNGSYCRKRRAKRW